LNTFKSDTLFIKCILALYLSGQLKLFHIYPVNMVNSKKWLILASFRMYPSKLLSNDVLVICPKNKPFFSETLKAGKAVAEPPNKIDGADAFIF
jgi:hypothetical protein